jgi:hypothetical protein
MASASSNAITGLSAGDVAYWRKRMPGASDRAIRIARAKQIQRHNPEAYGPGTNLTPLQLERNVNSAANLRFGPQQQLVNTQLSQVDPVFDAYRTSLANAATGSRAGYQQAATAATTAGQNLNAADQQARDQLMAQMQQDAASRGGSVDPSAFATAQQAAGSRQSVADTDANLARTLGANQDAFLTSLQGVADLARENRRQNLQSQQSQVAQQVGAFKTTERQSEINAAIQQALGYGNLGVSQQNAKTAAGVANVNAALGQEKAAETHRHNVQSENISAGTLAYKQMTADRRFKLDSEKFGFQKARDLYQQKHKVGPYKPASTGATGLTPFQQQEQSQRQQQIHANAADQFNTALGFINKAAPDKKLSTDEIVRQFQSAKGAPKIPQLILYAAAQQYAFGGVGPKTGAQANQRYGLKLKQFKPKGG